MATLTDNGLEWDKYGTIFSKLQTIAQTKFESLLPEDDTLSTDESSVLGRILAILSEAEADNEELVYELYSSLDPEQASGLLLDKLVGLFGITRKQATPAIAGLILRGDIGVTVPSGSYVSNTKTGDRFTTYSDVTFSNNNATGVVISFSSVTEGTAYSLRFKQNNSENTYQPISIEALSTDTIQTLATRFSQTINAVSSVVTSFVDNDYNLHVKFINFNYTGNFSVTGLSSIIQSYMPVVSVSYTFTASTQLEGDLNVIQSTVLGWREVYNPYDSIASTDTESDSDLRTRFKYTKGFRTVGTRQAIVGALYQISGVRFVSLQENIQDREVDGRVGHGISVTVLGGDDTDIGNVIAAYRPVGCYTNGNMSVTQYDENGLPYVVNFSRPEIVPIQIQLGLITDNTFPTDGVAKITDALLNYFDNLNVGQDIMWSQLLTPINTITGQSVSSIKIGVKGQALTTDNIEISYNQLASLSYEDIII